MEILKYHTTTSTNDVLKEMARHNDVAPFTVIWALYQSAGRGQKGNIWLSEAGKNLTFSIYIPNTHLGIAHRFMLNQMVSLAVFDVLSNYIDEIYIKWPNDILADRKKIAGILIDNTLQGQAIKYSVVGIGLNVNQTIFDESLNQATSLKMILGKEFDLETLLVEIREKIKQYFSSFNPQKMVEINRIYCEKLIGWYNNLNYINSNQEIFTAKIIGISDIGQLHIQYLDGSRKYVDFQEIKLVL